MPAILKGQRSLIDPPEFRKKFKSGLRWISLEDLKANASTLPIWGSHEFIPGAFEDVFLEVFLSSTLVHPGDKSHPGASLTSRAICSAKIGGKVYPGEAWYDSEDNDGGLPWCDIIGPPYATGFPHIVRSVGDFKLLFNPGNAAEIDWLPWPKGTWDTDFPLGVVKSHERFDLMVGRYTKWTRVG